MGVFRDFLNECVANCKCRGDLKAKSDAEVLVGKLCDKLDEVGVEGGSSGGSGGGGSIDAYTKYTELMATGSYTINTSTKNTGYYAADSLYGYVENEALAPFVYSLNEDVLKAVRITIDGEVYEIPHIGDSGFYHDSFGFGNLAIKSRNGTENSLPFYVVVGCESIMNDDDGMMRDSWRFYLYLANDEANKGEHAVSIETYIREKKPISDDLLPDNLARYELNKLGLPDGIMIPMASDVLVSAYVESENFSGEVCALATTDYVNARTGVGVAPVLQSANGTYYQLVVADDGTLSTEEYWN